MTPDELPADMEAAIAEVEALVLTYADNRQYDAFRALLKAYQEQRRALEIIAESHDAGRHDGLPEACPAHDADTMFAIARAALNQKGDER